MPRRPAAAWTGTSSAVFWNERPWLEDWPVVEGRSLAANGVIQTLALDRSPAFFPAAASLAGGALLVETAALVEQANMARLSARTFAPVRVKTRAARRQGRASSCRPLRGLASRAAPVHPAEAGCYLLAPPTAAQDDASRAQPSHGDVREARPGGRPHADRWMLAFRESSGSVTAAIRRREEIAPGFSRVDAASRRPVSPRSGRQKS